VTYARIAKPMDYEISPKISTENRQKLNKYSDVVAQLLWNRGFGSNEQAEAFISVDYDKGIHDPFDLKDINTVTERILRAISNDEKICIYSDYDADGIPGAVVLSDFFRKINFKNFFVYIPHRNKEGFGLNKKAIEKIADQNAKLIITIDCGISDVLPINFAVEKNIDVIVTDHHDPNDHKSKAIAVINPKQKDCNYKEKNLCGAGVIFKVVQALIKKGNSNINGVSINPGWEKWLLDMVGIATLSDMVPLVGENRIFAKYGLAVMRKSPRKGFVRLLRECKVDQTKIVEDDVGFSISPRINAASRMDEPETAYRMLFTDSDVEADETVKHLHKINAERKSVVSVMVKEIKKDLGKKHDKSIVVRGSPDWSPSLLGLAANSVVEAYKKPVFLWGRGCGENLKGSCRSDGTVDLVKMMNAVAPGFIGEFGGHEMAGGFIVYDDGVYTLPEELEKAYEKAKNDFEKISKKVDAELILDDVNWNLFNDIQKLAPFGVGNEKPSFIFKNLTVEKSENFGKEKNHLKLSFKKSDGRMITAIKFFAADNEHLAKIISGQKINLVANLEKSDFGRYPELRLRIVNIQ
jgi:single-stranded-DNA-specific exonuclease